MPAGTLRTRVGPWAITLLAAGPCLAQDTAERQPFQAGPIGLTPRIFVGIGADTNVYNTLVLPVQDAVFTSSPSLKATLVVRRKLRIRLAGQLSVRTYLQQTSERLVDKRGEAGFELAVGRRLKLFGDASSGQYRDRFSLEIDERLLRSERRVAGGLTLRVTRKIDLSLTASESSFRYEHGVLLRTGGIADALDRNSLIGNLRADVALTPRSSLVLLGETIEDQFASGAEVRSQRAMAGFATGRRAAIAGTALFGVRTFSGGRYQIPVVRLATRAGLPGEGELVLAAERDLSYSATGGSEAQRLQDTFVLGSFRAEIGMPLPLDVAGRAYVGVEQGRYVRPTYASGVPFERIDRLWRGGVSLEHRLGDTLRTRAYLDYLRRESSLRSLAYSALRFGAELGYVP